MTAPEQPSSADRIALAAAALFLLGTCWGVAAADQRREAACRREAATYALGRAAHPPDRHACAR